MNLVHQTTTYRPNGTIEIGVIIINQESWGEYVYTLGSKYDEQRFMAMYSKSFLHGKALALLKKNRIEERKLNAYEKYNRTTEAETEIVTV